MIGALSGPTARQYGSVEAVIEARAVDPLFQPLVELATGAVVGYEALARGPAGTPWESPAALFAGARSVGRDAELDWVCRARAYAEALAADLNPALSLFVNTEPTALRSACPADLAPVVDRARGRLRVITELTERAIAHDPAALLAAAKTCRDVGWGVALDDVGADPGSLAFMPFLHPDVVKLDMHLVRRPREPYVAQVVTAVLAYAERSGASILAEGIETEQHLQTALTMGATLGQGWLFGRPGRLPQPHGAAGRAIPTSVTLLDAPTVGDHTPFEVVAAARPVKITTKAQLMPISRYLEARADDPLEPPVLLASFQRAEHFTPATARRLTAFADNGAFVAAVAADLDDLAAPGVRTGRLRPGDPLRGEWNVIVVGPHFAAALVARDRGDAGPDRDRRFDYVVTHDRDLVLAAARPMLRVLEPAPTDAASTWATPAG